MAGRSAESKRPAALPPPAVACCDIRPELFERAQRGGDRKLGDEGGAAPVGAKTTGILRGHIARRERRSLVAGEDVALRLGQVGIVIAQIQREHLPGKGEAGVPIQIARVGDTSGKRRHRIEGVGRSELPV